MESVQGAIDALIHEFPPRELDPASAFAEWGGTYTDHAAFKAGARGQRWTELSTRFLERQHDALPFLGPSSFGAYLPAYLAAALRQEPALDSLPLFVASILHRDPADPARFDARIAPLTLGQRAAVAHALAALEASLAGSHNQPRWTAALDSYWRSLIQP